MNSSTLLAKRIRAERQMIETREGERRGRMKGEDKYLVSFMLFFMKVMWKGHSRVFMKVT